MQFPHLLVLPLDWQQKWGRLFSAQQLVWLVQQLLELVASWLQPRPLAFDLSGQALQLTFSWQLRLASALRYADWQLIALMLPLRLFSAQQLVWLAQQLLELVASPFVLTIFL